jgi:hypothetical protein
MSTEDTINTLMRALAEALAPYLPDAVAGTDVTDSLPQQVSEFMSNEFDPSDWDIMTNEDFDPSNFGLLTENEFDPERHGLITNDDLSEKIAEEVKDMTTSVEFRIAVAEAVGRIMDDFLK